MTTLSSLQSNHADYLNPSHNQAKRLIASVSQSVALLATPYDDFKKQRHITCRETRGLTQAIFLVFFYKKFGFLPVMDNTSSDELWQSLSQFEIELRSIFYQALERHHQTESKIKDLKPSMTCQYLSPEAPSIFWPSFIAVAGHDMQTPEMFDTVLSVLNLHTGWSSPGPDEAQCTKLGMDLNTESNCMSVLINESLLNYFSQNGGSGQVPAYYIAPWRTFFRVNAKPSESRLMDVEMKRSAQEWYPTTYDLITKDEKTVVCRFTAPNMTQDQLDIANDVNKLKNILEIETLLLHFNIKNIKLIRSPVQRKQPALEIKTESGKVVRLRTPLPKSLFPFPHYVEPCGLLRMPRVWEKVDFNFEEKKLL